jgi:hypothetical protein
MIPAAPPLVVPKTRTTKVGGQTVKRESLTFDIQAQGLSDLHWMLRRIAAVETAGQLKLQNPPSVVIVDKSTARPIEEARKSVVVFYGTRLASVAMRLAENILRQNIERTTNPRTGRLRAVTSNWRWRLVTPGKGSQVVTSASDLPAFVRGSMLVLEPYGVPHATRVNQLVIGHGTLRSRRGGGVRGVGAMGPPKPKAAVGFLAATAQALRARAEFKQFAITVVFSRTHAIPGEISQRQGTGSIVIQLKRR